MGRRREGWSTWGGGLGGLALDGPRSSTVRSGMNAYQGEAFAEQSLSLLGASLS